LPSEPTGRKKCPSKVVENIKSLHIVHEMVPSGVPF
jgi:hypothetical protein